MNMLDFQKTMDIAGKTIWQQASGDTDRDYSELCLKWDVILNGPGYAGPWPDCAKRLLADKRSSRKVTDLRRFAEDMKHSYEPVLADRPRPTTARRARSPGSARRGCGLRFPAPEGRSR